MENILPIEIKETTIKTNKPVYLGLSIVDIEKKLSMNTGQVLYGYDYKKLQCRDKAKLDYNYTYYIIVHMKLEDIYPDLVRYVEKKIDTSNY